MTRCSLPPTGWRCNLEAGHEGPCPAWPDTFWLKLKWSITLWDWSIWRGHH